MWHGSDSIVNTETIRPSARWLAGGRRYIHRHTQRARWTNDTTLPGCCQLAGWGSVYCRLGFLRQTIFRHTDCTMGIQKYSISSLQGASRIAPSLKAAPSFPYFPCDEVSICVHLPSPSAGRPDLLSVVFPTLWWPTCGYNSLNRFAYLLKSLFYASLK